MQAVGARLAKAVAVVLLIASINFMLVHAAPGDPALVIAGQSGATDQRFLDSLRAEYGLDQPVAVQLGTYLGKVVRFDLGYSYRQQRPVLGLIGERLPAFGYETIGGGAGGGPLARALDIARHLVLPAASLGVFYLAVYARLMRASIIEVSQQDYVKTARAKGVPEGRIVRRHMLRNAMLPVITVAGVQAGTLIGGSVVVETVFAWPGLGRLIFEAVLQRDYPVLLGIFLVLSVLVIAFNLLTDALYRLVDPRIGAAR